MTTEKQAASICTKCQMRPSGHTELKDGQHRELCCECYVGEGNPPADWHPACIAAYQASKPPRGPLEADHDRLRWLDERENLDRLHRSLRY